MPNAFRLLNTVLERIPEMLAAVTVVGDKVAFAGHVCEVIATRQNGERKIRLDVGERVWIEPDAECLLITRRTPERRIPMSLIPSGEPSQ